MSIVERVFHNPHLYSAAIMAKMCTALASLVWGLTLLIAPDATGSNANYQHLLRLAPEDVWGGGVAGLSLLLVYRLVRHYPPCKVGVLGYAFLALFWSYLWWGLIMGDRVRPAGISSGTILMLLSLYAFIANPKRDV